MTTQARQASAAAHAARLPNLVRAMLQPGFYPDQPATVDLRQTHISIVFLAGDFVYKIKKPVRFAFLDASKLERRFEFCRDEVRLNSRLARGIYLGVVPIFRRANSYALGPVCEAPVEEAVEYAVKMRRLDDVAMLDRRLNAGTVTASTIRAIAKRLAEFHASCSRDKSWQYGSAAAVWRTIIGNLEESESFASAGIDRALFEKVENFCRRSIRVLWETINERARTGRAPEGHGDLRCEHVCLEEGRIEVIDCVEFSEALRYGDVALDVAFLAMDLERLGVQELAREFVRAYIAVSGDEELATVMPLYKCHRALVRAKVAALKSEEPEIEGAERERACRAMHEYFALAAGYADQAAPALVVVCGRSGTGKSTIARALRERTGFAVINSDRVRKKIAGLAPDVHARAAYGEGIYSARSTHATYETMLHEAESALTAGRGAILDATYRDRAERRSVLELARRSGTILLLVECRADKDEVLRRLSERESRKSEVSDATAEIYLQQESEFMPLSEIPERNLLVADSTRGPDTIADQILSRLAELRAAG